MHTDVTRKIMYFRVLIYGPPTPRSLDECSTTELMVPNLEKIGEDLEHFETLLNHLHTHTRCLDSGLKILVMVAHVAGVEPASPNGRGSLNPIVNCC